MKKFLFLLFVGLVIFPASVSAAENVVASWEMQPSVGMFYSKDDTGSWDAVNQVLAVIETCGNDCRYHESLFWELPEEVDPVYTYRVKVNGCSYVGDSVAPEVGVQLKILSGSYTVASEKRVTWTGDISIDLEPEFADPGVGLSLLFAKQTGEYGFDSITVEKVDTLETIKVRGDCDGDGRLTPADAVCIMQICSGIRH